MIEQERYRELWMKVLLQFIQDCFTTSKTKRDLEHCEENWRMVEGNEEDFKILCQFAGFSSKRMRRMLKAHRDNEHVKEMLKVIEKILDKE